MVNFDSYYSICQRQSTKNISKICRMKNIIQCFFIIYDNCSLFLQWNRIYYKLLVIASRMGCGTSEIMNSGSLVASDQYQRKQMIGVGHFSKVYRSISNKLLTQYALKVVDRLIIQTDSPGFEQNRSHTLARLKQVNHPRLVQYYDLQIRNNELSITMDLAEGTLKKNISKNGKFTQKKVSSILENIIQGLVYLHHRNIIHKDLKTNNVVVFKNQNYKISDFGLAQFYDTWLSFEVKAQGLANLWKGDSLPFMAPQIIKRQEITEKSDIWSLGCIAIEMLTGKSPWMHLGKNLQETLKKVMINTETYFPSKISNECKQFLKCCLNVSPAKRKTAKELINHKFIKKYSKKAAQLQDFDDKMKQQKHNPGKSKQTDILKPAIEKVDKAALFETKNEEFKVILNNKVTNINRESYNNKAKNQDHATEISLSKPQNKSIFLSSPNSINSSIINNIDCRPQLDAKTAITHSNSDKDYFKKPLRLLKKKLKKRKESLNNTPSYTSVQYNPSIADTVIDNNNEDKQNSQSRHYKTLEIEEQGSSEMIINTQLARAQKDKLLNQKLIMTKKKQQQRMKWQQQLQRQAQTIKKQFSNRYAYRVYQPVQF